MSVITKELALKIAEKLQATIKQRPNKAHDIALVYHEGRIIAQFGIRRGSRKDLGHDYIPRDLHIRTKEAKLLGQCPLLREDWLRIMSEKGLLSEPT